MTSRTSRARPNTSVELPSLRLLRLTREQMQMPASIQTHHFRDPFDNPLVAVMVRDEDGNMIPRHEWPDHLTAEEIARINFTLENPDQSPDPLARFQKL